MSKVNTVGMRFVRVTVPTAGVAVPILPAANPDRFATDFELFVLPANVGANMYIGNFQVNNQWIPRPKGVFFNFTHGDGTLIGCEPKRGFDLSKIFLNSDGNGDIAIVQYLVDDGHS